jgi:hypothetical protein
MRATWWGLAIAALVACGGSSDGEGNVDGGTIIDGGVVDEDAAPEPSALLCLLERRSITDSSLLQRNVYEYNERGQIVALDVDSDGDGSFNYRDYRSYNGSGQLTLEERDSGFDGTINRIIWYVRDPSQGGRVLYYLVEGDVADGDGAAWDYQWNYEYNVDGQLIARERDNTPDPNLDDGEGAPDIVERRVRIYDTAGRLVQLDYDRAFDTSVNYREIRSYDDDGRLIQQDIENEAGTTAVNVGDLDPTEIRTWDYDDQGRHVQRLFDRDADGIFDEREERIYDCE